MNSNVLEISVNRNRLNMLVNLQRKQKKLNYPEELLEHKKEFNAEMLEKLETFKDYKDSLASSNECKILNLTELFDELLNNYIEEIQMVENFEKEQRKQNKKRRKERE